MRHGVRGGWRLNLGRSKSTNLVMEWGRERFWTLRSLSTVLRLGEAPGRTEAMEAVLEKRSLAWRLGGSTLDSIEDREASWE